MWRAKLQPPVISATSWDIDALCFPESDRSPTLLTFTKRNSAYVGDRSLEAIAQSHKR